MALETILVLAMTGIPLLFSLPWIIDTIREEKRRAQESSALSQESSKRKSNEDAFLRRYLIGSDPKSELSTPPHSVCYEVIRLLEEDLDEGIARLSQYYRVPAPKVEINEALLKARKSVGMYTNGTIYLTLQPKIRTVLHEFAHYLMEFRDSLPDKELSEILADMFADHVCMHAASYLQYDAKVNITNFLDKRIKRCEQNLRRSLEEAFPDHPEIVEELLNAIGIDVDEDEEDDDEE